MRTCTKCLQDKPLEDFHPAAKGKFGRRSECRKCANEARKGYKSRQASEANRRAQRRWWASIREDEKRYRARLEYHSSYIASTRRARLSVSTTEERQIASEYRLAIKNDPCYKCGNPGEHTDHLFALAKGGKEVWYNLGRLCAACNWSKSTNCVTSFMLK